MIRTTTSPPPDLGDEAVKVTTYYEEEAGIPSDIENEVPSSAGSNTINWLCAMLPVSVEVDEATINDKPFYRFAIRNGLRKHSFVVSPLHAYMIAKSIGVMAKSGVREDMLIEGEKTGRVFIPKAAWRKVYEACRVVAESNKLLVQHQLDAMHALLEDDNVRPTVH